MPWPQSVAAGGSVERSAHLGVRYAVRGRHQLAPAARVLMLAAGGRVHRCAALLGSPSGGASSHIGGRAIPGCAARVRESFLPASPQVIGLHPHGRPGPRRRLGLSGSLRSPPLIVSGVGEGSVRRTSMPRRRRPVPSPPSRNPPFGLRPYRCRLEGESNGPLPRAQAVSTCPLRPASNFHSTSRPRLPVSPL